MSRFGVAVIGAGVVGRMRASVVLKHARLALVSVADVDEANARRAAGSSARAVADYREAIDTPGVDIVVVATPGHLHEEAALQAFGAGKHVLCEKPLAPSVDACRRIISAAQRAGRTLGVGFNHRYFPAFRRMKDVVESNAIGEIDHVRAMAGHPGLGEFRADWMYQSDKSGGGAMMDIGIHLSDMVRHAVGPVTEVSAICTNRVWHVPGSEDDALVLMKTASGVPVRYHATWSEWKGYRMSVEVYGSRGMIGAYYAPMANLLVTTDGTAGGRRHRTFDLHPRVNLREKFKGWQTTAELAFADEMSDFLRLIDGQPTRIADAAAGLGAVAVAHAAYASSARAVSVPVET